MDPKRQGSAAIAKSLCEKFIHFLTKQCADGMTIFSSKQLLLIVYGSDVIIVWQRHLP